VKPTAARALEVYLYPPERSMADATGAAFFPAGKEEGEERQPLVGMVDEKVRGVMERGVKYRVIAMDVNSLLGKSDGRKRWKRGKKGC
jgi:hypothetical protein